MLWLKILKDYSDLIWPIIFGLVYFIKRHFDLKSKKLEINHTVYQQNQINAINNFFKNYTKVTALWRELPIYNIVDGVIPPKDIDKIIFPPLNELNHSVLELRIYFDGEEHLPFEVIMENFKAINSKLLMLHGVESFGLTSIEKVNNFEPIRDSLLANNHMLLDKVFINVRKNYN